MSTYKITKIDKVKGHISVVYSIDNIEQTMCDCPLDSEESIKAFLDDYGVKYDLVKTNEVKLPAAIDSLVGKTFTVPEVPDINTGI